MAVKAGYAGGGSPTRRAAQTSCSPELIQRKMGDAGITARKGLALTAWAQPRKIWGGISQPTG